MSEPTAKDRDRAAAFLAESGSYDALLEHLAGLLATSRDEGAAADGTGAARELGACLTLVRAAGRAYGLDVEPAPGNALVSTLVGDLLHELDLRLLAVHDLASARLRSSSLDLDASTLHDLREIVRLTARASDLPTTG